MSDEIKNWANGHKDVLEFFEQLEDLDNNPHYYFCAPIIYNKLRNVPLRGENLHFLFKVLGCYNPEIIVDILKKVPEHILVKACSRSASYGKNLIQPYIK